MGLCGWSIIGRSRDTPIMFSFSLYGSTFLSIIKAFFCSIDCSRFPLSSAPVGVEGIALVCDMAEKYYLASYYNRIECHFSFKLVALDDIIQIVE